MTGTANCSVGPSRDESAWTLGPDRLESVLWGHECGSPTLTTPANLQTANSSYAGVVSSRDARIRTGDPLNPIQVRYRTALRPDFEPPAFKPPAVL